jgi:hypothetical protein
VLTDDVSLQVFMEHLKKLAVSSSSWGQYELNIQENKNLGSRSDQGKVCLDRISCVNMILTF